MKITELLLILWKAIVYAVFITTLMFVIGIPWADLKLFVTDLKLPSVNDMKPEMVKIWFATFVMSFAWAAYYITCELRKKYFKKTQ